MKKYLFLFGCFAAVIAITIVLSITLIPSSIDVNTVYPNIIDYNLKCSAKGTIKSTKKIEINYNYDIVVKQFHKQVGDSVSVGDVLFTIDKEKTIEMLKNTYSSEELALYSEYINSFPLEYKSEYDAVITKINEKYNISGGENIIELSAGSGFVADVFVSEKDIANIFVGQEVEIIGDAFKNKSYKGLVEYIADTATEKAVNGQKETVVNVKISISNPDNSLKTGYNIKADIFYGKIKNAVAIPYEALREDETSYYVYKLYKNFAVKSRVEVILEDNDFIIINGSLDENSQLCITKEFTNDNYQSVNVINEGIKY